MRSREATQILFVCRHIFSQNWKRKPKPCLLELKANICAALLNVLDTVRRNKSGTQSLLAKQHCCFNNITLKIARNNYH